MRWPARLLALLTLACCLMPAASADTAQAIATGVHHSCLLNSAGGVQCWGYNNRGQLGDGTTTNRNTPVQVSGLTSGVTAITAGYFHTCALTSTGAVKCWGSNGYGRLGDGTTTTRNTPVQVSGLVSGVTAITADGAHTCAVTSSGAVQCWGYNAMGQLGDGTTTDRNTPVQVSGLTSGITIITAGTFHTCALTSTGAVKCWGSNGYGRLGDNTNINRTTPVAVYGLTSGVNAIAAGKEHTCAVTSAGGMQCWGYNYFGQLGDGTTTQRNTPVQVSGLTSGVIAITAGVNHSCALTSASAVLCWGSNDSGQLGNVFTSSTNPNPFQISGLSSGVTAITAGDSHTCAVTSADGVACWGSNDYGQLGDNSTTDRTTPVGVVGFDELDGDGYMGSADDLPLNIAASIDTDHDGKPDNWNAGCDATCQAGSGLVLDDDADDDGIPDGIDPLLSWTPLAVDGAYSGSSAREYSGSE